MGRKLYNGFLRGLVLGILLVGTIVGLQVNYLLRQLAVVLEVATEQLIANGIQTQRTLLYAQAVLSSVRGTTEQVRKSAEYQIAYYDKIGRRTGQVLDNLYVLTDRADSRMERATRAIEVIAGDFSDVSSESAQQIHNIGVETKELLGEGRATVQVLLELAAEPAWSQSAENLAASSLNTERATANVAEAAGYIRDMLSPKKKSFWRRLLELMLPRPTLGIR